MITTKTQPQPSSSPHDVRTLSKAGGYFLLCFLPFLAVPLFATEGKKARILIQEDFDKGTDSGLAKALLAHRHISLAKGAGPDGSNAIRVAYVGYERGSQRVGVNYPLDTKVEQATLSFDVRFDKDFQWTQGGKLHGMGPQRPITGGIARRPDGWSARVTFRAEGRGATYLYDQDKERKYGVGHRSDKPVFTAGCWHRVVFQVSLNTPGKADGFARILIANQEVVKSENIVFRAKGGADTQIQRFLFSTFHGGSDSKWTPIDKEGNPTTVYAYFDNFMMVEGIQ